MTETHRYPREVVSLERSARGDLFGVLTNKLYGDEEVFVGSFSSGQILKSWSLGSGRSSGSLLAAVSLSLNEDGSSLIVPVLPPGNSLPKGLYNLHLFDSRSGAMVKSVRTSRLVGQVVLLADNNVLAAPIDAPGLFSKKLCIERWSLNSAGLEGQFCDQGRNVFGPLSAAPAAGRVVGFASRPRKDLEGYVYAAPGRVDVWDIASGDLIASSDEFPSFVPSIRISADGEWILADQVLLQLSTRP
jgi:hypothetical protein